MSTSMNVKCLPKLPKPKMSVGTLAQVDKTGTELRTVPCETCRGRKFLVPKGRTRPEIECYACAGRGHVEKRFKKRVKVIVTVRILSCWWSSERKIYRYTVFVPPIPGLTDESEYLTVDEIQLHRKGDPR